LEHERHLHHQHSGHLGQWHGFLHHHRHVHHHRKLHPYRHPARRARPRPHHNLLHFLPQNPHLQPYSRHSVGPSPPARYRRYLRYSHELSQHKRAHPRIPNPGRPRHGHNKQRSNERAVRLEVAKHLQHHDNYLSNLQRHSKRHHSRHPDGRLQ